LRVRLVIGALVFLAVVAGVLFAVWPSRPQSVHRSGMAITEWVEYRQYPGGEGAEYQLRIHNERSSPQTVSSGCSPLMAFLADATGRQVVGTDAGMCPPNTTPVILRPGQTYVWSGPCFTMAATPKLGVFPPCYEVPAGTYTLHAKYGLADGLVVLPVLRVTLPGNAFAWAEERVLEPLPSPAEQARVE
jgi:hypothetical protein